MHRALVATLAAVVMALLVGAADGRRASLRDPHAFRRASDGLSSSPSPSPPYATKWFTQTLDHFNMFTQPQTYQQRYLVNDQYFVAGGPLFFYTGNEGDIVAFYENTGLPFEWAQKMGAYIVFAEHRFYGESLPFGNNSFNTPQVALCSAEQALADYAALITSLKATIPELADAPVIAFGGSYGGMLAAWFRMKYPNIVLGSLAASAPILEFVGLCNGEEFSEIVTADFAQAAAGCSSFIQAMYNKVLPSVAATPNGFELISEAMSLCTPITNSSGLDELFEWSQTAFLYMAMTDYPYPADFLQPLPANPVNASCALALANNGSVESQLVAFAQAAGLFYNATGSEACFDLSQSISANLGMAAWNYQACSEMVFPIGQNGQSDMFWPAPFDLKAYSAGCEAEFGVAPRADWIPQLYGGNAIATASNIIFSNGVLDPWISGGVTTSISESLVAIVIEHAAHHLDLRWSDPADPQSVVAARAQELTIVQGWLDEFASERRRDDL